jgi:phosphatidylserine decarboxylase
MPKPAKKGQAPKSPSKPSADAFATAAPVPAAAPETPASKGRFSKLISSVQGSQRYISMKNVFNTARNGMRFNEHTRRVRTFARRAALIAWIEPAGFVVAAVLVSPLYLKGYVSSLLLCVLLAYAAAQVLMALFSIGVMLTQISKSESQAHRGRARATLHHISQSSGTPAAAIPAVGAAAAAASDASASDADDDDAAPGGRGGSRSCRSACRSLRPPQVVRWDIVGVTLSNWFGKVNSIPLPLALREPLYRAYAAYTGAKLDEVKLPLRAFSNLQEFFSRELKPGLRPIADTALVSPVDARIIVSGPVEGERVEQVKGVTYPLPSFLGEDTWAAIAGRRLYHCVLYLAPGDYHRIHSGADCSVGMLRHFPGTLFPISPVVARLVPNLFALNERVVLSGAWEHGFYSATAVGAYHVGSMAFNFDKNVRTNRLRRDFRNPNLSFLSTKDIGAYAYDFEYPEGTLSFSKGDEVGTFKLGSTIVLVFEVPQDAEFEFLVQPGEKVQMGQALGRLTLPSAAAEVVTAE